MLGFLGIFDPLVGCLLVAPGEAGDAGENLKAQIHGVEPDNSRVRNTPCVTNHVHRTISLPLPAFRMFEPSEARMGEQRGTRSQSEASRN